MELVSKKISMRLPEELLEEMDLISSIEDMDRTEFTKYAVREFIRKLRKKSEFREQLVELYLESRLTYDKLELVLGKEDALALKASKEIMEQGVELAKKLV